MHNIEIYSKSYCPFCKGAKKLLKRKGLNFTEYEITGNQITRDEMILRSGRTTVPQIFIDGIHIGGGDDIAKAEASGELDLILGYITNTPAFA